LLTLLNACATTQSSDVRDPWEGWNRKVQSFNDGMDDYAMKPAAKGYRWITPSFVDTAITNVFSNINDIGVTINDFLQGKFLQSGLDGSRFLVNTTAGIGGLIDVASMIDLPKHNEDFGQTLGYWGVPTGPYLVLPFFGPSSPRGAVGLVGDADMNHISYIGSPYISGGAFVLDSIDKRADNLGTEKIADEAAPFGRYEFFKNAYIAKRKALVLDGEIADDEEDDFILDDIFDEDDSFGPVNSY
jgi:phospholipid-binding lipoprotein MlaA